MLRLGVLSEISSRPYNCVKLKTCSFEVLSAMSGTAMDINICSCSGVGTRIPALLDEQLPQLKSILPEGYEYTLCTFAFLEGRGNFHAELRMPLHSKEALMEFKKAFEEKTLTTMRVAKTYPNVGPKVAFKMQYQCQHNNTKGNGKHACKKIGCRAMMCVTLQQVNLKRSRNAHLPGFPAFISLRWCHNHTVNAASVLRFRDVGDAARDRLLELFLEGHSAPLALDMIRLDLMEDQNYALSIADRQKMPDYAYAFRLHRKFYGDRYGKYSEPHTQASIAEHIKQLEAESGVSVKTYFKDQDKIVSLVTPLMIRVHQLVSQSGETVFLDTGGNTDRSGLQVILLMTHSPVGGLPLGAVITSSLQKSAIENGLKMLQELFPENAFFGRGAQGPTMIMTDCSEAEKKAIQAVYPEAKHSPCPFHILQALWHFMWNRKRRVNKDDCFSILNYLKGLLYATSEEELEKKYVEVAASETVQKYPGVVTHFKNLWDIKQEWALALRKEMLSSGANADDILEAAFSTLRDKFLGRWKNFNIIRLLDIVSVGLSGYYSRKLLGHITHATTGPLASSNAREIYGDILPENISQISDNTFSVTSEGHCFQVYTTLGICTCQVGSYGGACKHKHAVQMHRDACFPSSMPLGDEDKRLCYLAVAAGKLDAFPISLNEIAHPPAAVSNSEATCKPDVLNTSLNEAANPPAAVSNSEMAGKQGAPPIYLNETAHPPIAVSNSEAARKLGVLPISLNETAKPPPAVSNPELTRKLARKLGVLPISLTETVPPSAAVSNAEAASRPGILPIFLNETAHTPVAVSNPEIARKLAVLPISSNETAHPRAAVSNPGAARKLAVFPISLNETAQPPPAVLNSEAAPAEGMNIEHLENCLSQFRSFCSEIEQLVRNDPETLLEPLKTFIERGTKCIGSKTALATALATFGIACDVKKSESPTDGFGSLRS